MSTSATPAQAPDPARRTGLAKAGDVALALLAHVAVGAAWGVTALAVMGTLDVARRAVMNSEWVFNTGRLPQPWVIPLGIVAIVAAHLFFRWAMTRAGGGRRPYEARIVALAGAALGVALGAYFWTPALQVGAQVGPASGQSTPWGVLGWAAHHARLALPAVLGLVTAFLVIFSRHSPLRWFVGWAVTRLRRIKLPRRRRAAPAAS